MTEHPSQDIQILAIESSCDETAAAVVANGRQVRSNVIATQIPVHRLYGGVVPEIASRHHLEAISPVVQQALSDAGCTYGDIHAIAVANGPGLVGSLLVGVSYGKALAFALGKPLLAVHHWQGHLAAVHIEHQIQPPFLALVVSGSHSGLLRTDATGSRFLGRSHDDAAGEAFDKIARALGLPYPGGPEISRAAEEGGPGLVEFPRAWLPGTDDFSFSGLKSAVLNYLNQRRMKGDSLTREEICSIAWAAQEAICDVLSAKAVAAAVREQLPTIALVGGVAANRRLRQLLTERAAAHQIRVCYPSPVYCTDNAAMIVDEFSTQNAEENCNLNSIENYTIIHGDASSINTSQKYDYIFANIHKNIIINDLEKYVSALAENGHILLSGFYTEDADDISKHAETLGLTVFNSFSENNWTVLELVRR